MADRSGTIHKGYFPKNYVKAVEHAPNVPKPPPRPTASMEPPASQEQEIAVVTEEVGKVVLEQRGPSFSLKSCSAFDELMELGYALELDGPSAGKGEPVSRGVKVEIRCKAEIWDGASTATKEFANGVVTFVTGESQVTAGLDAAVQKLTVGQKAIITCSPAMAYGAAGNPPVVPPNSFVVFTVEVLSASSDGASDNASHGTGGTQALLGSSGVASTRKVKGAEPRRGSRMILVEGSAGAGAPEKPAKPSKPSKPASADEHLKG